MNPSRPHAITLQARLDQSLLDQEVLRAFLGKEVIITVIEAAPQPAQKTKLRSVFARMAQQKMFQQIDDPTAWQKQQRDEWT